MVYEVPLSELFEVLKLGISDADTAEQQGV
jgi:hypothetical protein